MVADILSALVNNRLGLVFFREGNIRFGFLREGKNLENAEGKRSKKVASSEKSGCRSQRESRIP